MICISTDFRDNAFKPIPAPSVDDMVKESSEQMQNRLDNNFKIRKDEREFERCVSFLTNAVVYSYFTPIDPEDIARIVRDSASHILERDVWSDKRESILMRIFMHGLSCIISDYKNGLTTNGDAPYVSVNYSFGEDPNKYRYAYDQTYDEFLYSNLSGIFDSYLFNLM